MKTPSLSLSTAPGRANRCGCGRNSGLENSVEFCSRYPEHAPALLARVNAKLPAAEEAFAAAERAIPGARRGTRSGNRIGAQFSRAMTRLHGLRDAAEMLGKI